MSEGRIPQSFIDEVLLRTDIVDLVDARVKLKRTGKNYSACCPFHQEKSPSFTVNREKQFYYCFGCGASGNALSFLMEHDRLEFIDGLKQLAGAAGLTLPETRDANATPRESHQPLFDTLEAAAHYFEQQLRTASTRDRAVSYFKSRGLSGQIARQFRLGYAPAGWDHLRLALAQDPAQKALLLQAGLLIHNEQRQSDYDAMRDRVIFPIRDFRGRVIAFGGRVLNDDKPKYLNSPESPVFHKGQELYGLYEARQAGKLTRILVVEGYMDVVALAQFGIHEAVATLGTATSTSHIERLFRVVPEVVFCFDGDAAGRRAAWRALENALPALRDGYSARFLFLPDGEDPDSLVRREGPELFRARIDADSVPLAEQLYKHLSLDIEMSSLEGRSKLATEAIPLLALMPESLFRTLLVQRLSAITELPTELLEKQLLAKAGASANRQAARNAPAPASPAQADAAEQEPPHWESFGEYHGAPPNDDGDDDGMHDLPALSKWQAGRGKPGQRTGFTGKTFVKSSTSGRKQPPALRTLSAQAIRLLLRDPRLALNWTAETLAHLQEEESPLLRALVDELQLNPDRSIAALLGSWHGTSEGDALAALAAEDMLLPASDTQEEAESLWRTLQIRALDAEIAALTVLFQAKPERTTLQALTEAKQRQALLAKQPNHES